MALELDIENLELVYGEDRYGKLLTHLIAALVAKGWTVEGSGDGLAAFENSGQTAGPYNVFTSGLGYYNAGLSIWSPGIGGANSFSNQRAWVRIKEPAPSVREFIFQRPSASTVGYDCYMAIAIAYDGFLAGGAAANTPPTSAGTTQFLNHTVFNAVGASWGLYSVSQSILCFNTLIANVLISDTARAGNVWPFHMVVYDSTFHRVHMGWMYESLAFTAETDADPLIVLTGDPATVFSTPIANPPAPAYKGRNNGVASTTLQPMHPRFGTTVYGNVVPVLSPHDSKIRTFEIDVVDTLTGTFKGRMEHFMLNVERRDYPKVSGLATANPKLYLGAYMMDWATNVIPGT